VERIRVCGGIESWRGWEPPGGAEWGSLAGVVEGMVAGSRHGVGRLRRLDLHVRREAAVGWDGWISM